jgi:hypothetical protein
MNKTAYLFNNRRGVRCGRASSYSRFVLAAVVIFLAVQASVAQNIGSIGQASNASAPYNTVYFGIYPQTFNNTVLEAMAHLPTPSYPTAPFVVVATDGQVLNGGAVPMGKNPRGQATIINVEPLKWRIVKDDAEGILLFTDGNVDVQPYNDQVAYPLWDGKWETSSLRSWFTASFLNGHSAGSIPQVYKPSLSTSHSNGLYNDLIGVVYPHADLPSSTDVTPAWSASGDASLTNYFTVAEKGAIVLSALTNPTRGANPDNQNTDDLVYLPSVEDVEAVYPIAVPAYRNSVNTRYTMSFPSTTSAPADDDWITRSHSSAPFPGYVTQIRRTSGIQEPEAVAAKKPIRPALHLNRDRVLMVSQSKPAAVSATLAATSFLPSNTLKLTLIDATLPSFTAGTSLAAVNGFIPVGTTLLMECNGGSTGANSFISCLLEDATGIKYYTKASACTGAMVNVTLNFTGVTPGTYSMKVFNEIVNATDKPDYSTPTGSIAIYIAGGPLAVPVINTAETLSAGFEGKSYTDTVKMSAVGSPAPTFAISDGALPAGLTLNAATGRISGTLAAGTTGAHTFKVKVQNPAGFSEEPFTLTVYQIVPPEIATQQSDLITAGAHQGYLSIPYSFQFQLQPGTGQPYVKFSKTGGNLPAGLTLDDNGTLHGSPTTVETQNFTICAETEGTYDYQSYTLSILTSNPLALLTPAFATANLGTSAQVRENTSFADTTIQITGSQFIDVQYDPATFPTGMTFDPYTRKITGMPILGTAGPYNLKLWAKNPATKPADPLGPDSIGITYALTVLPANVPLITTASLLPPAGQGLLYGQKIVTDLPATLSLTGMLPSGIVFTPTDSLVGTPTVPGTYTFTITATNADGYSTKIFTLDVQAPLPAPLIDPIPTLSEGTVGIGYTGATLTATSSPTSWTWTGAPTGLTLSNAGVISGTPTGSPGIYTVSITAANAFATSVSVPATIVIRQSPLTVAPTLVSELPDAIDGIGYGANVFVFNRPDIVWTIADGDLPYGLTFEDGAISGTPVGNTQGRYTFTVSAASATALFTTVIRELSIWVVSYTEDGRSRKVTLEPVARATTDPAPDVYYVKTGDDFGFVITPANGLRFVPEVTTSRAVIPDAEGIIVTPNADGTYTISVKEIREDIVINVIPQATTPVESAEKVWSTGNRLYILTPTTTEAKVYNLAGTLVKVIPLKAGETGVAPLPSGIYIIELHKGAVFKAIVK